jgi:hypothetical protein
MGQMKIQHKLFLGFFVIAVLIIIFGHIAMRLNENIATNLKQLSQGSMIENMYAMAQVS